MMQAHPVLYLCKTPHHGDAHWRIVRPYVRLKEAGVDARLCWLGPDDLPTQPVAGRVVVVQRAIADEPLAWVARLHEAGALAVVMELDDDELTGASIDHLAATHPISTADRAELERQRAGLIAMTRACDGVTVSTEPLAEVVRRYTDGPVIVCPNAIDARTSRSTGSSAGRSRRWTSTHNCTL
jgi:hypothetical protein